jgi:PhnB protein
VKVKIAVAKEGADMAAKPNPIPDRYRRVTPALVVDGAAKALEFYAQVFGATERARIPGPGGTIAHAEIELGDSVLIVEDASPYMGTKAPPAGGLDGSPIFLYVYVEDVDATIERAVKLGATQVRAAQDQFYGDRDGFIVDPFGHAWTVSSHIEDVEPAEMMRRMAEMQGS